MVSGSDKEREMQNLVYDVGKIAGKPYVAIRFPASGSNPRHEMPDLLIKVEGDCYAFEMKYTAGDYANFPLSQVNALIDFADDWGAEPRLVARFGQHYRKFWHIDAHQFQEKLKSKGAKSMSMKRRNRDEYDRLEDLFDVDFDVEKARDMGRS